MDELECEVPKSMCVIINQVLRNHIHKHNDSVKRRGDSVLFVEEPEEIFQGRLLKEEIKVSYKKRKGLLRLQTQAEFEEENEMKTS
jgi:hypothetical protein